MTYLRHAQSLKRLLFRTATNNILARCFLLLARFGTKGWFAPWRHRRFASDWSAAFTTTVRVIVRVHDNAANFRTLAQPTGTAGFTDFHELVILVAHRTDRCTASFQDAAHFTGAKTDNHVGFLFAEKLSFRAGCANKLSTFARLQLDVVDKRTDWNVFQWKRVAHFDVCGWTGNDRIADFKAFRRDDVALLAIDVVDQSDVRSTVRIVFDRRYAAFDAVFGPLEVDDAVFALVSAAVVTNRDFTLVVPAGFFEKRRQERFLRHVCCDLFECRDRHVAASRGSRFVLLDRHFVSLLILSG
ncbi:Uncharacterized NAD(FAD)-dependent dehydrogenase [Paenibacillus sp. P22]|nr:Uncharacterized NAD(FAD)-dependent dehydrogenase [Paenibacillus sp. P22]